MASQTEIEFQSRVRDFFTYVAPEVRDCGVCVCLSGGADSVSLLCALEAVSKQFGVTVYACHFNHMIRGAEADRDEEFCKKLCEKKGIRLFTGRKDVPYEAKTKKLSLEDAARQCRYEFFLQLLNYNEVKYCATAHTMNDNAETLLINLMRGSGIDGASAISPKRDNILRPLLRVTRQDVESYLSALHQDYVTDSTNADNEFTRNYVRSTVLPAMSRVNPNVVDALCRFAEAARHDRDYFESILSEYADSDLRLLPKAISERVVLSKYKAFTGKILNNAQLAEVFKSLAGDARVLLPVDGGSEALVVDGKVTFLCRNKTESKCEETPLVLGRNTVFSGDIDVFISHTPFKKESFNKITVTRLLSFDNIKGKLRVRTRREGDRIRILGVNRSVKKLFIEKKIPCELRNAFPLVCDDAGIIYVPFVGVTDRAFPKNANNAAFITTVFNKVEKERWLPADEEKQ